MGYNLVLRIILLILDYSVDIPGTTVCRTFPDLLMPPAPRLSPSPPCPYPPGSMASTIARPSGWLELPTSRKKCWFRELPPPDHWQNFIALVDSCAVAMGGDEKLSPYDHLLVW